MSLVPRPWAYCHGRNWSFAQVSWFILEHGSYSFLHTSSPSSSLSWHICTPTVSTVCPQLQSSPHKFITIPSYLHNSLPCYQSLIIHHLWLYQNIISRQSKFIAKSQQVNSTSQSPWNVASYCPVILHCTALHCTALHCTALYYTVLLLLYYTILYYSTVV